VNRARSLHARVALTLLTAAVASCDGPVHRIPLRAAPTMDDRDDEERSCDAGRACTKDDERICFQGQCVECVTDDDCSAGYTCEPDRDDDDRGEYECVRSSRN
jgi:hypothetical protein